MAMYIMIPSGERASLLRKVIKAWNRKEIQVIVYTWDRASWSVAKRLCRRCYYGQRKSFSILHNFMIQLLPKDWAGVICGSDDLFPSRSRKYDRLEGLCKRLDGKVLWVYDGINDKLNTHPIITRGWFKKNRIVFDEQFSHHCCDTDLMMRTKDVLVRVRGIAFDHRHPLRTPIRERDRIYQIGYSTLVKDRNKLKAKYNYIALGQLKEKCERVKI